MQAGSLRYREMNYSPDITQKVIERFGSQSVSPGNYAGGMQAIAVSKSILVEVVRFLKEQPECRFDQLSDVVGIDYLGYPRFEARFALAYPLLSTELNQRTVVKVWVDEQDMTVPTLTGLFPGALWPEREAAEMFGFVIEGHPDPRRLLLCDLFKDVHPLRKDYPMRGLGERESFEVITREKA